MKKFIAPHRKSFIVVLFARKEALKKITSKKKVPIRKRISDVTTKEIAIVSP